MLDIMELLWQNIVLEEPIRYTKSDADNLNNSEEYTVEPDLTNSYSYSVNHDTPEDYSTVSYSV